MIWYNCIFYLNSQTSHSAMGGSDMVNWWWWWWCSGWPTVSPHSKTVGSLIPAPWVSLCADVVWGARQANGEPEVIHKWPTFVSMQRRDKPSSHGQRELECRRGGDRKPSVLSAIIILQWKWNNSGCCVRQEAPVFFTSPVVRLQALSCCFIMKLFSGLCAFKPGRSAYTALLGLKC